MGFDFDCAFRRSWYRAHQVESWIRKGAFPIVPSLRNVCRTNHGKQSLYHSNECLKSLTSALSIFPYDPCLWLLRSSFLLHLGYPELAVADAYKARLLADTALNGDPTDPQGLSSRLTFGMIVWTGWNKHFDPDMGMLWEAIDFEDAGGELDLDNVALQVANRMHVARKLTWQLFIVALEHANAVRDSLNFAREAFVKFSGARLCLWLEPFILSMVPRVERKREAALEASRNDDNSTEEMDVIFSNGHILKRQYPWIPSQFLDRDGKHFQELRGMVDQCSDKKCTLKPSGVMRLDQSDPLHQSFEGPHYGNLGVFARQDFKAGDPIIFTVTPTAVTRRQDRCNFCCKALPGEHDSEDQSSDIDGMSTEEASDSSSSHTTLSTSSHPSTTPDSSSTVSSLDVSSTDADTDTSLEASGNEDSDSDELSSEESEDSPGIYKCESDLCQQFFCSKNCRSRAQAAYHRALCGCPSLVEEQQEVSSVDFTRRSRQVESMMLLRFLAIAVQHLDEDPETQHPLEVPAIKDLVASYSEYLPEPWNFQQDVVFPHKALVAMGIDPFADLRFDGWVLNTVRLRISNNQYADFVGDNFVQGVYPVHHLLNHSCNPNAEQHVPPDRAAMVVWALRDIKKGDEIFVSYVHLHGVGLAERRNFLCKWLAQPCLCERCLEEQRTGKHTPVVVGEWNGREGA